MQAIKVFIKVCIVSIVLGSLVIVSIGCTEKNEDKKKGPKTEVT